jgi:hypothetical protein
MSKSFDLKFEFCISEKEFISSLDKELWLTFQKEFKARGLTICVGCGYDSKDPSKLQIHITNPSIGYPIEAVCLCPCCHCLKHFQVAAENQWVVLVNSVFSQEMLISICREGNGHLKKMINENKIFLLKKTAEEYSKELLLDKSKMDTKIKAIFGSKFNWLNTR